MTKQHKPLTTSTAATQTTPTPTPETNTTPPTTHRRTRTHLTLLPTPNDDTTDNRAGINTTAAVLMALGLAATAGILTNTTAAAATHRRPEATTADQPAADQPQPAAVTHKAAAHKATPARHAVTDTGAAAWHPGTVVAAAYTVPVAKPTGRHRAEQPHGDHHHGTRGEHGHRSHHHTPRHAKPQLQARAATA